MKLLLTLMLTVCMCHELEHGAGCCPHACCRKEEDCLNKEEDQDEEGED